MSAQSRGAARERVVADLLRELGWLYKGTGDAHGHIDGIALRRGERPMALQIKGTRTPYSHFGPTARQAFLQEVAAAGWPEEIDAYLVWAPPDRKPPRFIAPQHWPGREGVEADAKSGSGVVRRAGAYGMA